MTPVSTFAGRRVALFGLGGSGLATARALAAGGAEAIVADDSADAVAKARAEGFAAADLSAMDWAGVGALILSPGVPLTHKGGKPFTHPVVAAARAAGAEVIGDIELFCRERAARAPDSSFIAVTGTNGKSTTTALIAHILREAGFDAQMGGNIGKPILELEPPARAHPKRVHVIEVSSFQIDLAPSLKPTIGVLLNITPDHLDRHGTMRTYAAIKERLVARAQTAVIGCDDAPSREIADRLEKLLPVYAVSARGPCNDRPYLFFGQGTQLHFATGDLPATSEGDLAGIASLRGAHNLQNALAALAVATLASPDAPWDDHVRAMRSFPGLPHRMEEVGRQGRVLFINDSKATNADSAEKALLAFPEAIHWIVGGVMKEGGIAPLAPLFPRVAKAYLIGASSEEFGATLQGKVAFELCGALDVALLAAARDAAASPADEPVVLLSPACASYDQFRSFEERGDLFRKLVKEMLAEEPLSRLGEGQG